MEDQQQKSGIELLKKSIEERLGIPYDVFVKLDEDEKEKIISEYHAKKPHRNQYDRDYVLVRFGTGICSEWLRIPKGRRVMTAAGIYKTGVTAEDQRNAFEQLLTEDHEKKSSRIKRLLMPKRYQRK